jgi:hypothetical protein
MPPERAGQSPGTEIQAANFLGIPKVMHFSGTNLMALTRKKVSCGKKIRSVVRHAVG